MIIFHKAQFHKLNKRKTKILRNSTDRREYLRMEARVKIRKSQANHRRLDSVSMWIISSIKSQKCSIILRGKSTLQSHVT